jgi:hypothetical protein
MRNVVGFRLRVEVSNGCLDGKNQVLFILTCTVPIAISLLQIAAMKVGVVIRPGTCSGICLNYLKNVIRFSLRIEVLNGCLDGENQMPFILSETSPSRCYKSRR